MSRFNNTPVPAPVLVVMDAPADLSLSLEHLAEGLQGNRPQPVGNSFGHSGTKTAFDQTFLLSAHRRGNDEATQVLWQIQNVLEDVTRRIYPIEDLVFTVNTGSPARPGHKIYMIHVSEPRKARIQLICQYGGLENAWSYHIDIAGTRRLPSSQQAVDASGQPVYHQPLIDDAAQRFVDL